MLCRGSLVAGCCVMLGCCREDPVVSIEVGALPKPSTLSGMLAWIKHISAVLKKMLLYIVIVLQILGNIMDHTMYCMYHLSTENECVLPCLVQSADWICWAHITAIEANHVWLRLSCWHMLWRYFYCEDREHYVRPSCSSKEGYCKCCYLCGRIF